MAVESKDAKSDDVVEPSNQKDNQDESGPDSSSQNHEEKTESESNSADEKSDKKQLGPRIDRDLAEDWKFIIQQLHDGKYKGRLSDEVANALQLYIGKVVNDRAMIIDETENQAQADRLEQYAEQHRQACSSVSIQSEMTEELAEMRKEIEEINSHNTRMLSQIVAELDS